MMNFMMLASFADVMSYVWYIFLALLILLVMITVHELGHYISGKIFKFGIEEFAIGFGPKLFSRTKKNGEKFSIRLIPLGGFCSFRGEDADDADPSAFNNKKPWQRIIVLVSGAFMNYLLALLITILMFGIYGNTALLTHDLVQNDNIPAQYNFQVDDVILKADGKNIYTLSDLMSAVEGGQAGDLVDFTVLRGGKEQDVQIMLRTATDFVNIEDMEKLYYSLGIKYELDQNQRLNGGIYSTGVHYGFFDTIGRGFEYTHKAAGTIFTVLRQLITGQLGIGSMGGTITTIKVTAEAISIGGFWYLLNIASFIGVNLAVFNLLPIPALDGSRVVLAGVEWIRRKPLPRRLEGIIHGVGFVIILLFAIFIDVQQCF